MTRVNITPASKGLYHHSYDISTIATLDFGEIVPVNTIDTFLTDRWTSFKGQGGLRLAPQVFPPYGKVYIKSAAFFVPDHQVMEYASALRENMSHYKGKAIHKPFYYAWELNAAFSDMTNIWDPLSTLVHQSSNPATDANLPDPDTYDFVCPHLVNNVLTYEYFALTKLGQMYYKVFKGLGYEFASFVNTVSMSGTEQDKLDAAKASANQQVSLVRFLAYCKIYVDMFLNGVMYNNSPLVNWLHCIHDNEPIIIGGVTYYANGTGYTDTGLLIRFLMSIVTPHEKNMYFNAWNSPNSPDGVSPTNTMQAVCPNNLLSPYYPNNTDIINQVSSGTAGKISTDSDGTYLESQYFQRSGGGSSNFANLSQEGLNLLNAIYKFVRRNNLFGSKAVQRMFARMGMKPDDYNSHYVHKLYEGSERIDFNAVMSNASTATKELGDYAGYGASGLNFDFNYQSSDYGTIICLTWLQVVPMMLHGFDPHVLQIAPQDSWTPEFDGKASRAIPLCEVAIDKKSVATQRGDKTIFGFTGIYDEDREFKDVIIGDFVRGKVKDYMFARDLSVLRNANLSFFAQSDVIQYFTQLQNTDMTDPFQQDTTNGDRFFLFIDWNIEAERPVLSKADSLDLTGSGDTQVQLNGQMMI